MGSPDAYECRRTELSQLKHSVATDEDVEQSYLGTELTFLILMFWVYGLINAVL